MIRLLELFGGIGAPRVALRNLGSELVPLLERSAIDRV